jgi:hypothetical protein
MVVTGMDADPLSEFDSMSSMNVKKLIAGGGSRSHRTNQKPGRQSART